MTRVWLALAVIIAFGAYLRGHHLGSECFDQDELYAVRITGLSPATLASVIARDGLKTNHPPLMSVPYLFWTALVGTDETAVRAFPWLASVLTLPAVFWLGRLLGSPRAGLVAAGVLAINPLHITYAQEARQYALLALLVTLSHVFVVRCITRGRRSDFVLYLVVSTLALLLHYFAAPALFGHLTIGAWLTLNRSATVRAAGIRLIVTLGLAGLWLAAWLPVTRYQSTMPWGHLTLPTATAQLDALAHVAGVRFPNESWWLLAPIALVVGLGWLGQSRTGQPLTPAKDDSPPVWPRGIAYAALVLGTLGVLAALTVVPRFGLPAARKVLEGYGYEAATIDAELAILGQTTLTYAAACITFGLVLLMGNRLVVWLVRRSEVIAFTERVPAGGGFVVASVLTVVGIVTALGLAHIPFFSTRNLIVLTPVVAVAFGLTVDRMLTTLGGRLVVAGLALLLALGAANYDAVAAPLGNRGGYRLGMDTPDWKQVVRWLHARPGQRLTLTTFDHPVTDPLLFYAAGYGPLRMKPGSGPDERDRRLLIVHWPGRADSEAWVEAVQGAGYTLHEEERGEILVLIRAERRR